MNCNDVLICAEHILVFDLSSMSFYVSMVCMELCLK